MKATLDFDKMDGLVPAVVQDHTTGEVLMVAFMNQEAWETTLRIGKATFYSRTRDTLWTKGLTSGNVQLVKEVRIDCDDDTVVLKVEQVGGGGLPHRPSKLFLQARGRESEYRSGRRTGVRPQGGL